MTRSLSASAPAQGALAHYLAKGGYDKHPRQLRHALAYQQGCMLEAVVKHFPKGTRATRPEGGYFLWVELPGGVGHWRCTGEHCRLASASRPGRCFRRKGRIEISYS